MNILHNKIGGGIKMSNVIYTSSISEFNKLSIEDKLSFDRVIVAMRYESKKEYPNDCEWEVLHVLSPSAGLLHSWINGSIIWNFYVARYVKEKKDDINYRRALVTLVNGVLSGKKIVILCKCIKSCKCHRVLVFNDMDEITGNGMIRKEIGGK
jgi:hypothetical protein